MPPAMAEDNIGWIFGRTMPIVDINFWLGAIGNMILLYYAGIFCARTKGTFPLGQCKINYC